MDKIFSADGRFFVAFTKTKVRIFQSIYTPMICSSDGTPVFDLSRTLWHSAHTEWQEDRNQLQFTLQCFPGPHAEINLYLDPETKNCILIENELIRNMSFEKALSYLKTMETVS